MPNIFVYKKGRISNTGSGIAVFRPNNENVFNFPVLIQSLIYKFDTNVNTELEIQFIATKNGTNLYHRVNNLTADQYYKYEPKSYYIVCELKLIRFRSNVNGNVIVIGIKV